MHTEGLGYYRHLELHLQWKKWSGMETISQRLKQNKPLFARSLAHLYTRMHQEVKVLSVISNSFFPF